MEPALELNCECKGLVTQDLMEGWRVRGDGRGDWREEEVGRIEKSSQPLSTHHYIASLHHHSPMT